VAPVAGSRARKLCDLSVDMAEILEPYAGLETPPIMALPVMAPPLSAWTRASISRVDVERSGSKGVLGPDGAGGLE
jgi:hypothetical protein